MRLSSWRCVLISSFCLVTGLAPVFAGQSAGRPPASVRSADDYQKWLELRDTFPADLIRREVLGVQPTAAGVIMRRLHPLFVVLLPRACGLPTQPHQMARGSFGALNGMRAHTIGRKVGRE